MAETRMDQKPLKISDDVNLALWGGFALGVLYAIALALLIIVVTGTHFARAHDLWINGQRNGAGEWCCGAGDCAVMDPKSVTVTSHGYIVNGWGTIEGDGRREFYHEAVPEPEAMPSPDGAYWRCKRPDGSRRCFFAPPPNT